jgi:hypothetical protein
MSTWGIHLSELDSVRLENDVIWLAAMYPLVKNSATFGPPLLDSLASIEPTSRVLRWEGLRRRLQAATAYRGEGAALCTASRR